MLHFSSAFGWLRGSAFIGLLLSAALGATSATRRFDIPAGDAAPSLRLAAQQAGREIMFLAESVRGTRTAAVKGEFTAEDVLRRMIACTDLQLVQDEKSGALAIARAARPAAPTPAPAPPAPRATPPGARPAAEL